MNKLLPLPRPEYAKQTEALLTDLFWRSPGSSLSGSATTEGYFDELARSQLAAGLDPRRLVARRTHGASPKALETYAIALGTPLAGLIDRVPPGLNAMSVVLDSLLAPRARGDKSLACVPITPDVVSLQTLHGMVNKDSPANQARAIEVVGLLGGSSGEGHVASTLLNLLLTEPPGDALHRLMATTLQAMARHVWNELGQGVENWRPWPVIEPVPILEGTVHPLAAARFTPFRWFWTKWSNLCDPRNNWRNALPGRRFTDWSLCLLRTGLAFAYIWEAEFFRLLHRAAIESRQNSSEAAAAVLAVTSFIQDGARLASIEPANIPPSEKNAWPALETLLMHGSLARQALEDALGEHPHDLDLSTIQAGTFPARLATWLREFSSLGAGALEARLEPEASTAKNTREFVRYLLIPRTSDDDTADQADFYYLARSNQRNFWFEPGPEWLVVVCSLLAGRPGGHCTLGELVDDLASLGIRNERSVLVRLLEEAGLSTDSPDADNALVIRSAF
ncbi:hypothetical protein [Falsiroseomonas ponticola]|uniref:hypothetical protein n=1 Tax=Falsiroseomonas ponticola TaxID=2786951 RepID=UPI00193314EF|nr:hypothetical protein [Roseomonas ponticola]